MMFLLFMFMLSSAISLEGGNISEVNLTSNSSATQWVGVLGKVWVGSTISPSSLTFDAVGVYRVNVEVPCRASYLLFLVSPSLALPLRAGDLDYLEGLIGGSEGAYNTFRINTSVVLPAQSLSEVPTAYTQSPVSPIPFYYMQDSGGNIVFATPIYPSTQAYNGENINYQLMLPLINRTFYLHILEKCETTPIFYSGDSGWYPIIPPSSPQPSVPHEPPMVGWSCGYYVKDCMEYNGRMLCEVEGCGTKDYIEVPAEKMENVVEVKKKVLPEIQYKRYIYENRYIYPLWLIVLLVALPSLAIVIGTRVFK